MLRLTCVLFLLLFTPGLKAQAPATEQQAYEGAIRFGPGVTAPHVLRKVDPKFDGIDARIQGNVLCELVVTEQGRASGIRVLSPLGYGLDERAVAAIAQWQFTPAKKDGQPVKFIATVEVSFRLGNQRIDEKAETQRTSFNEALLALRRTPVEPKIFDKSLKTMQDLAKQGFPAAMNLVATWQIQGDHMQKDPAAGLELLRKAAAKNFGPALYEIAIREVEGRDLPADPEQGLVRMRRASDLGSSSAQAYLGDLIERGDGVPRDLGKAGRYFRLCAARGNPECQYKLGKLLVEPGEVPERDFLQAVAWLQLAGEKGYLQAKELAIREAANLSPGQVKAVDTLKAQLVHK